jgi:hypothetical protein
MEMKRDEAPAAEEFDLIGELREAYRVQSKDAAYLMFDEKGAESERVQLRANLMYMAADALAAERDRADRAEAALRRLSDAHDLHVEMDKTFEYECPQCRREATS